MMKKEIPDTYYAVMLPQFVGVMVAFAILTIGSLWSERNDMDLGLIVSSAVAIFVAIIGVLSSVHTSNLQLKRDGKTIDEILKSASATEKDAALIRSDVQAKAALIQKDVAKLDQMSLQVTQISTRNEQIDQLAKELDFQKRLRKEYSDKIDDKDELVARISLVYEKNADLTQKLKQERHKNQTLEWDLKQLQMDIQQQKQEIEEYKLDIQQLEEERDEYKTRIQELEQDSRRSSHTYLRDDPEWER